MRFDRFNKSVQRLLLELIFPVNKNYNKNRKIPIFNHIIMIVVKMPPKILN